MDPSLSVYPDICSRSVVRIGRRSSTPCRLVGLTKYANGTYVVAPIALLDVTLTSGADTRRFNYPRFGGLLLFAFLHEPD